MKKNPLMIELTASLEMDNAGELPAGFLWGAASAAYQVEGATTQDNKGRSVWDYYLDEKHLAGPGVSGKVAIDFYNQQQYQQDIQLFKQQGINSYRFSIAWSRILPDGQGPVNLQAVKHYQQFIDALQAAGIKPLVTLYHWDMPESLYAAGGWENRDAVDWFRHYADVVFTHFSDRVDRYVLINEPAVEIATKIMAEQKLKGEDTRSTQIVPTAAHLQISLTSFNHILLAAAAAAEAFKEKNCRGHLGVALPLFPILTDSHASAQDNADAALVDGILNRWFLDAIYKGSYPADVLALAENMKLNIGIQPGDAERIHKAALDYLGVNYYAPMYIRHAKGARDGYAPESYSPDNQKLAFNGPVRPDQFSALLERIRDDYGNPPVVVTENGAGFAGEDVMVKGRVNDINRCLYLIDHIAAMRHSIANGANVQGYHVWSSHDNLEWLKGYQSRFGMIYVDYDTQQRTPKLSAEIYAKIIRGINTGPCECQ